MASFAQRQLALLGGQDPIAVLRATPDRLEGLVARLGEPGLASSREPGKWTARHILAHLADMEIVFGYRFRQTLVEQPHVLQGVEQDLWASRYGAAQPALALGAFRGKVTRRRRAN